MKTKKSKDKKPSHVIERRNKELYRRRKEGLTYRALAKVFGISSTAAFNIVCAIDYQRLSKSN